MQVHSLIWKWPHQLLALILFPSLKTLIKSFEIAKFLPERAEVRGCLSAVWVLCLFVLTSSAQAVWYNLHFLTQCLFARSKRDRKYLKPLLQNIPVWRIKVFLASMAERAGSKQPLTRGRYRLYLPVPLCNLYNVTMEQKRRKSQGVLPFSFHFCI